MTQNDEEVKTDLLLKTNDSTPRMSNELQSTSNTAINTPVLEEFPLMMPLIYQQDNILTRTQIKEFERKDRMCTKVMNDTTLRIYLPKAPNVDRFSQERAAVISSSPEKSVSDTEFKDKDEAINIQGQTCY